MTRPDIAKTVFKLIKHFKSPKPKHMKTVDHCLKYLNATKYLGIQYFAAEKFNLTVRLSEKKSSENNSRCFVCNRERQKKWWKLHFQIIQLFNRLNCKKTTHRHHFHHRSGIFSYVTCKKKFIWWKHLFQKLKFNSDHDLIIYNNNFQTIRLLNLKMIKMKIKLKHIDIAQC